MTKRTVLVTGGGTGIGWAISKAFLEAGDAVTICQNEQSVLDALQAELKPYGSKATTVLADLSSDEGCQRAVQACVDQNHGIDILVNNAAITGPSAVGTLKDMADDQMSLIVDVNLKAAYRCARYASIAMREQSRSGVIINIGSIASFIAAPSAIAYVMTKAGLLGLTKALALDLAEHGIRVNMVAPGVINTLTSSSASYLEERRQQPFYRPTPLIPDGGSPTDIASAVFYLCSNSAKFITGSTITLDGGMLSY